MKLGELRSLGHNIADSLACGIGFMIGVYETNIFAEASAGEEGFITVDFIDGTTVGSPISTAAQDTICRYRDALPSLCERHRIAFSDIKALTARYGTDRAYGRHFSVYVECTKGRKATDQYIGIPGRRLRRTRS